MIPHQLQLKNFLSYGPTTQTINFDPYHLIYLSGKNGHGKSALLEALTWLIWGAARKTLTSVKPDQGLMRLGQTHMMVIGEFSCNNQKYKIRREVTIQNNKAHLQLEFGLLNEKSNRWIALTEKTTRDTQEKIESVIGLSYESFINSAFLKQGSANEFSKKSAKERKEVFSAILGLGLYDTIRTKALQKIKMEQSRLVTLDTFIGKIDNTLASEKETTLTYEKIKTERIIKHAAVEENIHLYTAAEQEYNCFQEQSNQQKKLEETKVKILNDLEHIKTQIKKEYAIFKKEKKQYQAYSLQSYLKQQNDLMHELHFQQKLQTDQIDLQKEIISLETILNQAETLKNNQSNELIQLSNVACQLELQKNNCQEQLEKIPSLHTYELLEIESHTLEQKKTFFEKCLEQRKTTYQAIIAKRNNLNILLSQISDKKDMIASQPGKDPACPLCNQNLSINRKKFLHHSLEQEELSTQKTIEKIKSILPKLKEKIILLHEKTVAIQKNATEKKQLLQAYQIHRQQEPILLQEKKELDIKQQALKKLITEETEKIEQNWNDQNSQYQCQLRLKKEKIKQLNEIHYDAKASQDIQKKLIEINQILSQSEQMSKQFKQKRELLFTLFLHMKNSKTELAFLEKNLDTKIQNLCDQSKEKLIIIKEKIIKANHEKEIVDTSYFELKTKIAHYQTLHKEKAQLVEERETVSQVIKDYQIIAHATGKDGLQALLIEEAIPDIEHDANLLLSKLTNNQTQLFIESLKDLKSGGTKETLDIKISDNMGIRPYEMFSGGEAFRIDLALRIAISKLLAKKAGTALQTLIIDEGFGSQDEEGLAAIMDAMYKIQDDFEKIIVVSHLPAMKDQFPVHFIVEKKPQGSVIQIKELC